MGSPKELLRRPLVGFWAWLLCGIAMGAALPTQNPAIKDDYSTPDFSSTVIFDDYFGPTLPTTIEEDLDFPAETPSPSETNGETPEAVGEGEASSPGESPKSGLASSEDDSGPLTSTPKTFKIPEDLKETPEVPSVEKNVLTQVNSSDPTLGKETLQGDPAVASQEAPKETPSPDLEAGHEATELITERYPGITDGPVTVFATLEEDLLASPSGEEISRGSPPEGDNPLENISGEPNLDEELKPTSTSWEVTEAAPLEAEKDSPEPSMDESGTLEEPSSNSTVLPSIPEDLADQETGENVDVGKQSSLSSEDSPGTSQSSTGFPPIWPSPTHEKFGSPGTNDFDVGSLQPSPTSVDSGSPEGRGDTAPIPSSSGPELNHESPINLPSEEPEDLVDTEVSNSSSSDRTMDAPSDSGPPGDTLVRTSQLNASDIPWMGLSVTPEIPSQLPEDDELGPTSTVKEEEEDLGNPKSNVGTSLVSPLPGQESEIPDEKRSGDLLSGTTSSLNPGVETANSELEDSEATTTSNNVPEDEINPISSDSATVSKNESGALFDMTASSPPPVDHEGTDKAQEPLAETQGSPAEASAPASTDGSSSEKEGSEVTPSGSSGNIGSSLKTIPSASDEVDTEANSEDGSGSDLSSPDTELSPSSGTPPPMGRSGTLSDQLSPSQSLVENALTSGSSEGEHTFPSTSPDEALSGPLISEPDTTELPSNLLPGSQPQLPKENDMETGSRNVEDSPPPPVDNEGAAKDQGPYAEASAPGSTNEPSSEREGSEILPSGSPGNTGPSSENSDTIPSVSSNEVDTQANSEDHGVSDLPPSETELSSISGTPLSTSSQPPKEDEAETHSEVPEDSVSINGEETSSAPSIINPQSDPAEAPEESNISGDLRNEPTISPKEERIGSTSEPRVKEEPLLDGDNTQDKINTPSEQQQGSEDALETSIPSSGDEPAVKSGTTSPLVDTETSAKELSGETSSATIEVMLPNSEKEDGEPSPSLSSKTLDSSPSNEVVDESRDGEDGTGSASSAKTAVTVSNDGQPGSNFPVGQSVTSPVGGILALAPIEDEETSVSRDDAQLLKEAVSSEDATPQSASSAEGMETSASEPSTVGSQPSPDGEAAPGTSKEAKELQTSAASEKVSPLDSSTTDSQEPTRSEGGEFYGALNKESPAFPVEVAGTANSPPATDKSSQFLPEDVASSDGVEDSEDITNTISEVSSQDPLDRGSEPKTPTSEEDTKGRTDGELSLNKDGTETASVESANNGGSQLPPDGDQPSTTIGASEISEGPSSVNGEEGSLIPSAAESHSTFTEEVENADSESGTHPESQAPLDVSPTTEVQDSKSSEAVEEDTSNNGEKLSLTSSATESQSPGISDDEVDVSGDTGNGKSSPHEELEMIGSGSTNNGGAQPSVVAGGATETSDVSDKEEPLESSSSANEAETSLGSSAAESSTAPEDQEISGKPSDGDGMGAVNSEPATNAEPQPSPNDGPGGAPDSEKAGIAEVPGTGEESFPISAPESQAISSSNEGETSKTATNSGSQLPPGGELAAGTPPLDGAEISGASSSVPGEKGSLSPSTPESTGDSTSTKELGTASRKSISDEGSQLSADGTSPEDSLPSEGAEEPTESPLPSTPEEKDEVVNSPLAVHKGIVAASSADGVQPSLLGAKGSPAKVSKLASGKPELQTKPGPPQLSSKPEVLANTSKLASGKPELQTKPGAPQLSSKPEVPAKASKLASGKPELQTKPGAPQLSSKPEVLANTSKLASGKPELQTKPGAPQLSSKPEVPAKSTKLASGKPGLQGEVDAPQLSSKPEVPAKSSKLASGKPGLETKPGAPQLSSKPEVLANTSKLASGKPELQGEVDAPQLSSKPEVPAKASKLASGKPELQTKPGAPQLSSKPEVLANTSKLASGKPELQTKPGAPQLSSKPEVPAKSTKLASGKPGLQGEVDAPQLSSKPEVPAKSSKLASGKPGLETKPGAPQLSSKPEVLANTSKLASGKPELQTKPGAPQLSSKPEVPAKSTKLASGKPGLQGEVDAPQLSSKTEVPAKTSTLATGKPGLQLKADTGLLSFNSDVLVNSERTLPGKSGSASSESTSDSDEKDRDSSSAPDLSEEHQTFMKGKVALDLSNAKPGRSKPGVHLALSGVGLLATKSSEPTGKAAKKRSDSKKSKDKKTKPDEKSTIINGAPSAVSLYPYGASANDKQYVERKVDFNSPLFKPEIGIPLGKSLRNSLYFTDNGQIVFPASDKDISSYPNPPPRGFNGREEVPMLAVFWDNADFSKGSGTIFYQEYPCGNSAKHPLVQDVEAKIRRYVSSSYRARWLLKVTWVKVQHYPAQGQTSKTNTYQAILTTDGYRTYALFLYQEGGMQWDYAKLSAPNVLIGYTSGDGYFKNDYLMTKTPAEKYRPDVFQGYNTDMRGLWIYKLDSWIRVNYRQRCLDWLGHERLPSSWNRGLPPCPCSLQQGMTDNRYTISQKGGQNTDSTLLYSSSPNSYGAGVRCLYNGNGQLQEGRQERIWRKSRKNYPNNDEELKLHDWCCHKAGIPQTCEKYDQKRPRIGCQGYKPPIRG